MFYLLKGDYNPKLSVEDRRNKRRRTQRKKG